MTGFVTRDADETKIITISLPRDLLHEIDVARGVESRSSFIRRAATELMKAK
jgi:metal-responsive CopG/Arc/MetJ family transcriptional regulator